MGGSSLARGKWIEAQDLDKYSADSARSSLARGKWIEAYALLRRRNRQAASSLARGKWIEAGKRPFPESSFLVFPRKREVD